MPHDHEMFRLIVVSAAGWQDVIMEIREVLVRAMYGQPSLDDWKRHILFKVSLLLSISGRRS